MKNIFKAIIAVLFVLNTNIFASECREAIGLQVLDILSQELKVPYDEASSTWSGYQASQLQLLDELTSAGYEAYVAQIQTKNATYQVRVEVDALCDVVDYTYVNKTELVKQCIEACHAFGVRPSAEMKACVLNCQK